MCHMQVDVVDTCGCFYNYAGLPCELYSPPPLPPPPPLPSPPVPSVVSCPSVCNMMCINSKTCVCRNTTAGKTCCGCETNPSSPKPPPAKCGGICPLAMCNPIYKQPKNHLLPKCKPGCGSGPSNKSCTCCQTNCGCISTRPPSSPSPPSKKCNGVCPLAMCAAVYSQPANGTLSICKPGCGSGPLNSACVCCPTTCGCISPKPSPQSLTYISRDPEG